MPSELELYDARLSFIRLSEGTAELHLSYAHIHKTIGAPGRDTGKGWSQEAVLLLDAAQLSEPMPKLPNTIVDGYLDVNNTRYELLPLPFRPNGRCRLHLEFTDGNSLDMEGDNPVLTLMGDKVFL